ncbi:LacI family DNA-binding transcriptional regulator [Nonomuraea angiospora]|uniref:LacI family transcriptional regulator n=1 Tax=Nonomuraea angiospora TaxID=46172 RepID=A0ABR9LZG9_9ACTN|nr:LacI family DNA-binding transcriptional regulator [Nonomuraea angiospora]MBE1585747.1 LacI family transcriptional regulator [Nonomuraea angiospora]MDX3100793.1 LacI family DNA-binding transcriptional regulator [Nonomuraea angiospora]
MTERPHPPRLLDVAKAAGVSLATASRALTGSTGVSAEVAAHVQAVASQVGYVPNSHARALAGGQASMVGLIVHDVGDPYFGEIARGVLRETESRGYMALISQTERDPRAELARVRALRAHRVTSIVLAGSGYVEAATEADIATEVRSFTAAGGRVAVIGRHHLPVDAVLPDNAAGGSTLMHHLLDLGHRRLGVLGGPANLTTVEDRLAGLRAALAAAGLDWRSFPVVHGDFTREGGAAATARLMRAHPDLTAVVALNDPMAVGALSWLLNNGRRVPGEISVAGFDDVPVARDVYPALTTVRLPMVEMGKQALELVLKPPASRPRRRRTTHELVVRASTAPPPP